MRTWAHAGRRGLSDDRKTPPALLSELQQETQNQREAIAAERFDLEAVRLALHLAAHKGQSTMRVRAPLPGLHKTEAGKKLFEWCKRKGISATWEKRMQDMPDEGRQVEIMEPEFSW
jgi:hypothetical protein